MFCTPFTGLVGARDGVPGGSVEAVEEAEDAASWSELADPQPSPVPVVEAVASVEAGAISSL